MLGKIKTIITQKVIEKKMKMREFSNTEDLKLVSLNDNFNRILKLHPRVTSYVEFVTLFNYSFLSSGSIIEIGSHLSYSSIIMASAFRKNENRKLYAIDPFIREKGWGNGGSDDWIYKKHSQLQFATELVEKSGLKENVIFIKGYSNDVISKFDQINDVGMIFIDGDHSYDGCKSDLDSYSSILVKGGYLVMHDYNCPQHNGVKKAMDEFLLKNEDFEKLFLIDSILVVKKK